MPTTENSVAIFSYIGQRETTAVAERMGDALGSVEHHLYVIEFPGHGVKVGITGQPAKRLAAHARDAAAYGRSIGRVALTIPHENARANEKSLVSLGGGRREYIPETFETITEAIEPMTFFRADRAAHAAKTAAFMNRMQGFIAGGAL